MYKKDTGAILPVHQNDLKGSNGNREKENCNVVANPTTTTSSPTVTTEDLETITMEIHKLEKEDFFEAHNVKEGSPTAKPKSFPSSPSVRKPKQRLNNFVAVTEMSANAKDYGNFDFCVVEKKKLNVARGQSPRSNSSLSPEMGNFVEDSFPRRRRPNNRFSAAVANDRTMETNGDDDDPQRKRKNQIGQLNESKSRACKLCLCSALISVTLIAMAVIIMLHPSVQLYLRLRTNYIHVFAPPT